MVHHSRRDRRRQQREEVRREIVLVHKTPTRQLVAPNHSDHSPITIDDPTACGVRAEEQTERLKRLVTPPCQYDQVTCDECFQQA